MEGKGWLVFREGHPTLTGKNLAAIKRLLCRRSLHKAGRELYVAYEYTESDGIREKHSIWVATLEASKRNGFEIQP